MLNFLIMLGMFFSLFIVHNRRKEGDIIRETIPSVSEVSFSEEILIN